MAEAVTDQNGVEGTVTALDVGAHKIACLIADVRPGGVITVKGVGNRASAGIAGGAVVDMAAAEKAIRASVDQAEKMAGKQVADVFVSLSAGRPASDIVEAEVALDGHVVSEADIARALRQARERIDVGERHILHAFPAAFALDGHYGVKAPVGLHGQALTVALHVITVDSAPMKNLEACVRRAHLDVRDMVLAPYAAGLAALVEDEARMGAACIDIGAGSTGLALFAQGALVHSEILPVGGALVTEQIARALTAPFDEAERLKTFHGGAVRDGADERLEIEVVQVGEQSAADRTIRQPRARLTDVIHREYCGLLAEVKSALTTAGFAGESSRRIVLTGGAALVEGMRDLAADRLGASVRIARPLPLAGLPTSAQSPIFTVAVGLLKYAALHGGENNRAILGGTKRPDGDRGLARLWRWIKASF